MVSAPDVLMFQSTVFSRADCPTVVKLITHSGCYPNRLYRLVFVMDNVGVSSEAKL